MRARTPIAVLAAAGFFAVGSIGGAVAAGQIGSAGITNDSVRSLDLKDGAAVGEDDLKPGLAGRIAAAEESAEIAALQAQVDSLDDSGLRTTGRRRVRRQQELGRQRRRRDPGRQHCRRLQRRHPSGSSVEIAEPRPAGAGHQDGRVHLRLADGAVYGGGSPRVFLEINGDYVNTFDSNPDDAGTDNGDGTFTKTWIIPSNGRVGNAGVVQDSGTGSITVSDVVISGTPISFQ